jgi:hypothetical protein
VKPQELTCFALQPVRERMSFFVLVFDRHTRELRASERYEDMESAGVKKLEKQAFTKLLDYRLRL